MCAMSSVSASVAAKAQGPAHAWCACVHGGPNCISNNAVQAKVTSIRAWFMRELWLAHKWCAMLSRCQDCSNMQVSRHLSSCWLQ